MTLEERKQYLIKFLCDMGCYGQFLYNCKYHKQKSLDNDFESLVMVKYPSDAISHAFIWGDTAEGHSYWQDLAEEFESKFILQ